MVETWERFFDTTIRVGSLCSISSLQTTVNVFLVFVDVDKVDNRDSTLSLQVIHGFIDFCPFTAAASNPKRFIPLGFEHETTEKRSGIRCRHGVILKNKKRSKVKNGNANASKKIL